MTITLKFGGTNGSCVCDKTKTYFSGVTQTSTAARDRLCFARVSNACFFSFPKEFGERNIVSHAIKINGWNVKKAEQENLLDNFV